MNWREKFGEANVALTPGEKGTEIAIEIALPDRTMSSRIKVDPTVPEEEVMVPFVPFPVALPEDPELRARITENTAAAGARGIGELLDWGKASNVLRHRMGLDHPNSAIEHPVRPK